MHVITFTEMNIISILLCILVLFHRVPNEKTEFFGEHHFLKLVWMTIATILLNTISWIMEGCFPQKAVRLHMFIMSAFYFCQAAVPYALFKYTLSTCNGRIQRWQHRLSLVPLVACLIILTANLIHPFAFQIADNVSYERMSLYFLVVLWPIIYILLSVMVCALRYRKTIAEEKSIIQKLLIFTLSVFLCSVLSALIYGFTPWPFIALSLLYLYLDIYGKQSKALGMLAYRDSLTGVANATAYGFAARAMDEKIQSGNAQFAILVSDVNDLKTVNDLYGLHAGDQLLIEAAHLLSTVFAHSAVHRIGGDEFAILLEGEDYKNRHQCLKNLHRALTQSSFFLDGVRHRVSIASGLAEYNARQHRNCTEVFQAADKLMYENKICYKRGNI